MAKLRSVSTAFWSDPFIEDLTPNEKLLFLYLVTNEKTNMLGIYEASVKKISFETGLTKTEVSNALKGFEKVSKVKYINNFVVLVNFMKHQNFNTNMKKSAIDIYNNLPKELKGSDLNISKLNPSEGFETLLNRYGMVSKVEVEVEYKEEIEVEIESKKYKIKEDNITKRNIVVIDNSKFSDESLRDMQWIEITAMQNKVSLDVVKLFINIFSDHLITMQEQKEKVKDFKQHFVHWFKKQDLSQHRRKVITGKTNQV